LGKSDIEEVNIARVVASGAKVVSEDGAKEGKLNDLPFFAELGDRRRGQS
jgi:hypothetical protein